VVAAAVSRVHREREERRRKRRIGEQRIGEQRIGELAREQWGGKEKAASKRVPLGFRSDRVSELGK